MSWKNLDIELYGKDLADFGSEDIGNGSVNFDYIGNLDEMNNSVIKWLHVLQILDLE